LYLHRGIRTTHDNVCTCGETKIHMTSKEKGVARENKYARARKRSQDKAGISAFGFN
jgi:hypothetical protein